MCQRTNRQFRLAIIQLGCPSYKRSMFEGICRLPDVTLTLFVGDKKYPGHPPGCDLSNFPHIGVRNSIISIVGLSWVWQHLNGKFRSQDYDLVLLPEGILYLSNYMTMLRCWWNGVPFGLYTHGYNYQRKYTSFSRFLEYLRAIVHRRCDVLIVYSEDGARYLRKINRVPDDRIFIARNTLDIDSIISRVAKFTPNQITQRRFELCAGPDDILLVYVGRIEEIKNPIWVVKVVERLRKQDLPVRAVFVGDGQILPHLQEVVKSLPYDTRNAIRFIGRVSVEEVDLYLRAGDITVMPGMTGLAIVHSFADGRPFITIQSTYHGPEIAYLKHGVNGLMADANMEAFCDAVESLVINSEARKKMGTAAFDYAKDKLSMANQIKGFEQAINFIRANNKSKNGMKIKI